MRKKCVRWTCVRASLIAAVVAAQMASATASAESDDPSLLPRLEFSNLLYVGGFRLPAESSNGDSFSIGGRPVAFNPARNSLFVGSRAGRVAEVSIPSPVNSSNAAALPFAQFLQPFADPTEGRIGQVSPDGAGIDALMVHGNRLYGTASIYYDANNTQRVSHYSHSLQLNESSFQGWSQVWETGKSGFVSGLMAPIPLEWQLRLGGLAVTGQCCIPIVTRTSWGPASFAFDPSQIGQATVPATPLLYYSSEHPSLGPWDGSSPTYGATIAMGGVAVIAGTRTALFFGRNGTGPHCYGNGTGDQSLHNTIGPDGAKWCYDPTSSDKGSHAYPYRYQIWAYDLNDFAAVKAGTKQPWEVLPYGVWPFELPTPEISVRLGGVGYDAERQLLYVSQMYADKDGYSYRPVIHTLRVNAPTSAPPSSTVTSVTVTSDLTAPQQPGVTVRFSATPTGGSSHDFKWWVYDGSAWTLASDWNKSNLLSWKPMTSNPNYQLQVWVRSNGSTRDTAEASTTMPFAIGGSPTGGTRVTAVTIVANRTAPQATGTAIGWAATPAGGTAPHQYKWWVSDGTTWVPATGWSTSSSFTWTPTTPNSAYRIGVWVRSAGSTVDEAEASTSEAFAITGSSGSNTPVQSVVLGVNRTAPQPVGTTMTWTAAATGGTGSLVYKWWTFDGATWAPAGSWSSSNTFAWTPTSANSAYRIAVWVKRATNPAEEAEASTSEPFAVSAASAAASPVTSVRLTANVRPPASVGSSITWTATPTAGVSPHQYKWFVSDGGPWVALTGWSTSNTYVWTPTSRSPHYSIAVWVRSAGNAADVAEASATERFQIR